LPVFLETLYKNKSAVLFQFAFSSNIWYFKRF